MTSRKPFERHFSLCGKPGKPRNSEREKDPQKPHIIRLSMIINVMYVAAGSNSAATTRRISTQHSTLLHKGKVARVPDDFALESSWKRQKKKHIPTSGTPKKKIQKQLLCNKNFMNYSAVERYLFFFVMEKGESESFVHLARRAHFVPWKSSSEDE